MKNLFKTMMLVAVAAMGFTACSNEAFEEVNPAVESKTYTMTFVADAPNTRTSVSIDEVNNEATYSWSTGDKVAFIQSAVGEDVEKTNKKGSKVAVIDGNTATFTTEFDAVDGATAYNYGAYYPNNDPKNNDNKTFDNVVISLASSQVLTEGTFDPAADLLMSKPILNVAEKDAHGGLLEFTRLAAVGKMNLKGVDAGETIENVEIKFKDEVVNGDVTLDFEAVTATYATAGSNTITLQKDVDPNRKLTALADGTPIFFTCFPGEYSGEYTIEVETDKATYSKTGTLAEDKALSFTAGNVLRFNATMDNRIGKVIEAGTTVDVLNRDLTGVSSGAGYSTWADKTSVSSAVYAGNSAGANNSIQLRSNNNNSGIVTTESGGYAKKVTVTWNNATDAGRTLQVYGKNTAYTNATNLYNETECGTLLGTIVKGTSTELEINGDYEYIGMRSKSNAMYINEIEITWGPGDPRTKLDTPNVTATAVDKNVTVSWEPVANADRYTLTIDSGEPQTLTETTYTFVGEYSTTYNFSVVAVPSDTDTEIYRESDAGKASTTTGDDPNAEEPEEETFELTATATFANNQLTWSQNGITIVQDKGKGNSAVNSGYNKVSTMRVYQGHTLTFSSEYNITNVEIVTNGKYFGPTATASVGTLTNPKSNGCTITWEGSSKNLVITNGTGSGGEQIRATKIVITYTK